MALTGPLAVHLPHMAQECVRGGLKGTAPPAWAWRVAGQRSGERESVYPMFQTGNHLYYYFLFIYTNKKKSLRCMFLLFFVKLLVLLPSWITSFMCGKGYVCKKILI